MSSPVQSSPVQSSPVQSSPVRKLRALVAVACLSALVLGSSNATGDEFSASMDLNFDYTTYLHSFENAGVFDDPVSIGVKYWIPTQRNVEGVVTYRFPTSQFVDSAYLFGEVAAFNIFDSGARAYLDISANGIDWTNLDLETQQSSTSFNSFAKYDGDITPHVLGSQDIWVRARLLSTRTHSSGQSFYAQFMRADQDGSFEPKLIVQADTSDTTTGFPTPGSPRTTSFLVTESLTTNSASSGGAEYDFASITVDIDPANTEWIAWNQGSPGLVENATRPGEKFFGQLNYGTDDFIRMTITDPNGESLTVDIDQNNAAGTSFGPQNVLFGEAESTPDAMRFARHFTTDPIFFDEAGAFNSIFTIEGEYKFDFSFRNQFSSAAGHTAPIYLIVAEIPEPSAILILGIGCFSLIRVRYLPTE